MSEFPTGVGAHPRQQDERPGAPGTGQQAKAAAGEVAETAKEQTRVVAGQAKDQARRVAGRLRERAGEQAQQQSRRAAQGIRQWADELASMGESSKPDSPMSEAVQQIADTGRRAADYLEQRGLSGIVEEVQSFARRRPGVFLAGAAAAGFLMGRLAKATASGGQGGGQGATTPSVPATPLAGPTPAGPPQPVEPIETVEPGLPGPGRPSAVYPPMTEPPPPTGWGGETR
ncbi:hypothetical protein ACQPYK_27120 [Streptosporangium sp. CA-135522]|uniref:hypothetical protein n=1 Tax=Streptosporangium sp. CA-135522 TaxID=3240072 RepID=UPI003D90CF88